MFTTKTAVAGAGSAIALLAVGCGTEAEPVAAPTSTVTVTSTQQNTPEEAEYLKWERAYAKYAGEPESGAYKYHQEACDTLRAGGTEGTERNPGKSPAEYLHDGWGVGNADWDGDRLKPVMLEGVVVPVLCPEQTDAIVDAKTGNFERQFPTAFVNGKYLVGDRIQPGTYTISETVSDCYWERSDAQGNIIDNNFISIAPSVTVTILESDAGFTSKNCGEWKLAE